MMSAVQNDTLKINHCVNRAAPVSFYRDWPASLNRPVSQIDATFVILSHIKTNLLKSRKGTLNPVKIRQGGKHSTRRSCSLRILGRLY